MIAAIGMALSKFGSWVANNKAVQWVLGVLLFIVALILWGERREGQGRKQEKLKQKERDIALKERADAGAKRIIEEEETDADQAIEAGRSAMRAEPVEPDRMSDEEYRLTFGRDRPPGEAGSRRKV